MDDESKLVASAATNDVVELFAQINSASVILVDQSPEMPASQTNLLVPAALTDGPSPNRHTQSSSSNSDERTAASRPSADTVESDARCDGASALLEASSDRRNVATVAVSEKLHCDNIVVRSDGIVDNDVSGAADALRGNVQVAATCDSTFDDAATATTSSESGISSKNDESIDTTTSTSSNEVVINGEPSTLLTSRIGFDKFDFTDDFVENASKMERRNDDAALMASNLITSETMNDFFDEIYDTNYVNYGRRRKDVDDDDDDDGDDVVDGRRKGEPVWNATATGDQESKSCGRLVGQLRDDCAAIKSSLKRSAIRANSTLEYLPIKKSKKGITFDSVSVYYFPRTQGFTCIPSQGGSTLGMSWNHSHIRKYSLGEHAAEQRRAHRQQCSQQLASARNWNELSNVSSEDSDSDEIISDAELDYENYNFLQPIPTRERRSMLRSAGIHKIDSREKDECRTIRLSREFCGCTCQIYCDPERCVCAQAGIKCQVDRMNFPCSCTREGCANENGRIEFNPLRVRTHFIHTLMRLEMEKKQDDQDDESDHRLLLSSLENASQLTSYTISSASAAPSSSLSAISSSPSFSHPPNSNGCSAATVLSPFSYHPDSLSSFYSQQQPSSYDVSSSSATTPDPTEPSSSSAFVGYGSHQYAMTVATPAAEDSVPSYNQLSSVSSLALLSNSAVTSSLATEYAAMSDEHCLRLATSSATCYGVDDISTLSEMQQQQPQLQQTFHDVNNVTPSAYHNGAFMALSGDDTSKEFSLECQSESENLDTSTELGKNIEKEDESDSENFGDIIKKTMVESVIA